MKTFMPWLLIGALAVLHPAQAAGLRVFACEPEWAALATELGGERVEVTSATHAAQDVHYIQARPSLISQLRRADLLVCTGAGLEEGWLPMLLRRANNPAVQPGRPGHLLTAGHVPLLGAPDQVDRGQGHIHAEGNPHLQLDPRLIARLAPVLAERLAALDPDGAALYRARLADFEGRWTEALAGWEARAARLHGLRVVAHHEDWLYLAAWLGLEITGKLEPLPGVPPSSGHLARLEAGLAGQPVGAILRTNYQDPRPADWLAARTGVPVLVLPHTVGGEAGDLQALFERIVTALEGVAP
ncbi:MAG: zinc ABC transporter substrate-binding protein [Gammaproteobacteria bacterium]|nr:zinc ABC transporter substrate-binding protein [Gammaproteobacteria bacterium]